jgi:hypothetical protein
MNEDSSTKACTAHNNPEPPVQKTKIRRGTSVHILQHKFPRMQIGVVHLVNATTKQLDVKLVGFLDLLIADETSNVFLTHVSELEPCCDLENL